MKHPCPRYEPELSAYVDGETTPALRAEIDTHLRLCASCRAAVAQLRGVNLVLRRWDAHETRYATTEGFRNRVLTKVGAGTEIASGAMRWRIAAGLALVAAGAGSFALLRRRDPAPTAADYAALRADIQRLEAALDRRGAAPRANDVTAAQPLERLAPLSEIVTRPSADDAPAVAPGVAEVWEQHGDERILSEAIRDHDEFTRERSFLALVEQQVRMFEERRPEASAGPVTAAPPAVASGLALFLGEVRVASGNFPAFEQVQVWPIELASAGAAARPAAVSCSEAIARNMLAVAEGASTETVVAENKDATKAALVLAGDVIAGGRQDRVARQDVLIAPSGRTSIPTYGCGRSHTSGTKLFRHSDGIAPPEQRALAAADRAMVASGVDQAVFDASVDRTMRSLASPPGRSLDSLFSNLSIGAQAERLTKKFEKRLDSPSVVGFAFSVGSQILGVETFGDHATFADHRARLLQSYVLAVLSMDRRDGDTPSRGDVTAVLDAARQGVFHADVAAGAGTLSVFRGLDGHAFGFGLLDGAHVVHSVVFTGLPADADGPGGRMGRIGRDGNSPLDGGSGASAPGRGAAGGGDPTEAK